MRELDAAGIDDDALRTAYLQCRRLNATHGTTYFLATLLLPAGKRPAVHALYGFARWVDDVVDEHTGPESIDAQRALIEDVRALVLGAPAHGDDPPVVTALRDAARRWDIPMSLFTDFLDSMAMDLTVTEYATFADLERYMWGSAAVIGLQMLPVLCTPRDVAPALPGSASPGNDALKVAQREIAAPYAVDLGLAFQLTNFLRDLGDDLRRGRLYLPLDSLAHHGVERADLERGVVTGRIRRLLADEIARTREYYRSAAVGVRLLDPTSRDCIRTALALYGGILDQVETNGYRVFDRRARVSRAQRLAVAGPGAARAVAVRVRRPS